MIRRATIEDTDRINELLFQVQSIHADGRPDFFKSGAKKYTTEELISIIGDDQTPIYVFDDDGVIKGYAFCVFQTTEETNQLHFRKTLYIDDLCVDSKYRHNHIGEQLYNYVHSVAEQAHCDSVTLNVWELNQSAKGFYQKMGLKPLKTTMESIISPPAGLH